MAQNIIEIRSEAPADYQAIGKLVKSAFNSAAHADGNEAELVHALRASASHIPALSLVALVNGQKVGYIMFTKITIGGAKTDELALAPLAVLPDYQRQGVGSQLVRAGHAAARQLGYHYCVVLGDPAYYGRFGYQPASRFVIRSPFDVPDDNFMTLPLTDNPPQVCGIVHYDPAFGL